VRYRQHPQRREACGVASRAAWLTLFSTTPLLRSGGFLTSQMKMLLPVALPPGRARLDHSCQTDFRQSAA
jgi:hypothetical protein